MTTVTLKAAVLVSDSYPTWSFGIRCSVYAKRVLK